MRKILFFILLFFSIAFAKGGSFANAAASLSLSPSSGGTTTGQTFNVNINLNTGGSAVTGVDGVITFNASILEVSGFSYGTLFSGGQPQPTIDNTNGKLSFHPGVSSVLNAFSGQGVLATITLKGKIVGTSQVSFSCNESNIWSGGSDIIDCTTTTGGSYTITSGGGQPQPTSTPTPGSSGASDSGGGTQPTATPGASEGTLPEAGVTEWTFLLLALGIFFVVGGVRILLAKNL